MLPHVRGVQVTAVGTGNMGYLGNKGQNLFPVSTLFVPLTPAAPCVLGFCSNIW